MGPADQLAVEVLHSVLVYTSPPLERPMVVAGPVEAELHACTSAVDTDWVVKLCDVDTRGRSVNLQEGIVRARFRGSSIPRSRSSRARSRRTASNSAASSTASRQVTG
jgi:predicted acyl esterase